MSEMSNWDVTWSGFRGYARPTQIQLSPLTVLVGRNNVGKTSVYSPLLLLRQTLEATRDDTALLFNGRLVQFGSFADVVTDHDVQTPLEFSLALDQPVRSKRTPRELPRRLDLQFRYRDGKTALTKSVIVASDGTTLLTRRLKEDGDYAVSSPALPKPGRGQSAKAIEGLRNRIEDERPNHFFFSGVPFLTGPMDSGRDGISSLDQWFPSAFELYEINQTISNGIESSLFNICYLGPLRHAPQRQYALSAEQPKDCGPSGEHALEMLFRADTTDSPLLSEVNEWLMRLGYGKLTFDPVGAGGFIASIATPGSSVKVNIADCGMGLSQLLPVLVQGIAMGAGATLIAQQPEIHLNPAQQDTMADFLVGLCASGRRVVIETHSEHVLTRTRLNVALGNLAAEKVAVYFCDSNQGRSRVERIPVGELGELSDAWPTGFFGEQVKNAVALARAQARGRASTAGAADDT